MGSTIYFGNRQKQTYIPAPDVGMAWSNVKRSNLIALEGGGVYVDDSKASHREGVAEWSTQNPASFRVVKEFLDGVWGPGPFYWVDPFAADTNLLSPAWATPGIIADGDWPEIYTAPRVSAPTATPGLLGLPTRTVTYAPTNLSTDAAPTRRFTILIPPGYQLAFGCHGWRTGSAVVAVRSTMANGTQSTTTFAPADTTGTLSLQATNLFPYSAGNRFVDIFLARTDATSSTISLAAMRAIVVPEGATIIADNQPFVSGEGAGGLRFAGGITETLNYAPRDPALRSKGFSVKLVEIGDWG